MPEPARGNRSMVARKMCTKNLSSVLRAFIKDQATRIWSSNHLIGSSSALDGRDWMVLQQSEIWTNVCLTLIGSCYSSRSWSRFWFQGQCLQIFLLRWNKENPPIKDSHQEDLNECGTTTGNIKEYLWMIWMFHDFRPKNCNFLIDICCSAMCHQSRLAVWRNVKEPRMGHF